MHYVIRMAKKRKVRELVPVVHNLIFIHITQTDMKELKKDIPYLQYMTDSRSGEKIIVPDGQMRDFIAVAGTYDEHLLFFKPEEINPAKGTRVRIIGGDFAGYEGIFIKVKGARDRRVACSAPLPTIASSFSMPSESSSWLVVHHGMPDLSASR